MQKLGIPPSSATSPGSRSKLSRGVIAGLIAATAALAIAMLAWVLLCHMRRARQQRLPDAKPREAVLVPVMKKEGSLSMQKEASLSMDAADVKANPLSQDAKHLQSKEVPADAAVKHNLLFSVEV
jgi:hypothetical protein